MCASRCTIHFTADHPIDKLLNKIENGGNVTEETTGAGPNMAADELSDSEERQLDDQWERVDRLELDERWSIFQGMVSFVSMDQT